MNKKQVTSIDVAKEAGVSQSTVSMILNKKYNVSFSIETIRKVEEAAVRLGYTNKKEEKKPKTRMRGVVFVVCPNLNTPYYGMLLDGIEQEAKLQHLEIYVCQTGRDLKKEEGYLQRFLKLMPSGIIYTCMTGYPEEVNELAGKIPTVFVGEKNTCLQVDSIELDSRKPGSMIASYLLGMGHRKVGYIQTAPDDIQPARHHRLEGFLEEYDRQGLLDHVYVRTYENRDGLFQNAQLEYQIGKSLALDLIREVPDLTAIAGLNDNLALGAREALLEEKYRIPRDISVVGCDNILASGMKGIDLTTIDHYAAKKGEEACRLLVKKMETFKVKKSGGVYVQRIEYEPRLIIRGSSASAPVAPPKCS